MTSVVMLSCMACGLSVANIAWGAPAAGDSDGAAAAKERPVDGVAPTPATAAVLEAAEEPVVEPGDKPDPWKGLKVLRDTPENRNLVRQTSSGKSAAVGWHRVIAGELAAIDVAQKLYQRRDDPHFYVRVRVTNRTERPLGVDLGDYWKVIYPNQWGALATPERQEIDERRMTHSPLKPAEETQLRADFKAGKLTTIPAGKTLEYYRDFNAPSRKEVDAQTAGQKYLFVSLDGQQRLTDGQKVEQLSCTWDDKSQAKTDVFLTTPIVWADVPAEATVFAEGKSPPPKSADAEFDPLLKALSAKLPKNWAIAPLKQGDVQPIYGAEGKGAKVHLAPKKLLDERDRKPSADIFLWLMEPGYNAKPPSAASVRHAATNPAREIGTWRGRRVLLWGGGTQDWPKAEEDIQEALKSTDTSAPTQPAAVPAVPDKGAAAAEPKNLNVFQDKAKAALKAVQEQAKADDVLKPLADAEIEGGLSEGGLQLEIKARTVALVDYPQKGGGAPTRKDNGVLEIRVRYDWKRPEPPGTPLYMARATTFATRDGRGTVRIYTITAPEAPSDIKPPPGEPKKMAPVHERLAHLVQQALEKAGIELRRAGRRAANAQPVPPNGNAPPP